VDEGGHQQPKADRPDDYLAPALVGETRRPMLPRSSHRERASGAALSVVAHAILLALLLASPLPPGAESPPVEEIPVEVVIEPEAPATVAEGSVAPTASLEVPLPREVAEPSFEPATSAEAAELPLPPEVPQAGVEPALEPGILPAQAAEVPAVPPEAEPPGQGTAAADDSPARAQTIPAPEEPTLEVRRPPPPEPANEPSPVRTRPAHRPATLVPPKAAAPAPRPDERRGRLAAGATQAQAQERAERRREAARARQALEAKRSIEAQRAAATRARTAAQVRASADAGSDGAQAQRTVAAVPAAASQASAGEYRARVIAHLTRFKRYPVSAQARGAEGTPTVAFSLDGGGQVLSASLTRSSGHADIDAEALAMVRRAAPFPPPPPGAPRSMSATIAFRER
jgi:colicin import membrane protein